VSWLLFLVAPEWSSTPTSRTTPSTSAWATWPGTRSRRAQPDPGSYAAEYGHYGSVADPLRQTGHDEGIHKLDSLADMRAPRFGPGGWQPDLAALRGACGVTWVTGTLLRLAASSQWAKRT
jgi:hypothetical protein